LVRLLNDLFSGQAFHVVLSDEESDGDFPKLNFFFHADTSFIGLVWLRYAVAARLGWIFREQPNQDKGVDAQVEEVAEGRATGRLIGLQIKSGISWFKRKTRSGFIYSGGLEHLTYWQGHSLPILIVLFDPISAEAYWQWVSDDHVRMTDKRWTLVIPEAQTIRKRTATAWHQICLPETANRFLRRKGRFEDIAEAFSSFPERRQTLIYEALSLSRHSICLSTPYISADILSVLDYVAIKCPVRIVIGNKQPDDVWNLLRARSRPGFDVRVARNLHLKLSVFDSLFLIGGSANSTSIGISRQVERFVQVDESNTQHALESFFDVWNDSLDVKASLERFARKHVALRLL
jgi:hypothetical protein